MTRKSAGRRLCVPLFGIGAIAIVLASVVWLVPTRGTELASTLDPALDVVTGTTHADTSTASLAEAPATVAILAAFVSAIGVGAWLLRRASRTTEPTVRPAPNEPNEPREPTLSDSDCVKQLVIDNGGRMRQAAIVERVDWSKAKVSRLLTELEDEGEITKLRLGRENLICIRGQEPSATQQSNRGNRRR